MIYTTYGRFVESYFGDDLCNPSNKSAVALEIELDSAPAECAWILAIFRVP